MIAGLEQFGDERTVGLEVDSVDRRVRRKTWAFDEDELEPIGECALRGPRPSAADDAPVDEHDPLHRAIVACCNEVGRISFSKATFWCHKVADMLRPG